MAVNDADWIAFLRERSANTENPLFVIRSSQEWNRLLDLAEEGIRHREASALDKKIMGDWIEDASGKAEAAKDVARKCADIADDHTGEEMVGRFIRQEFKISK